MPPLNSAVRRQALHGLRLKTKKVKVGAVGLEVRVVAGIGARCPRRSTQVAGYSVVRPLGVRSVWLSQKFAGGQPSQSASKTVGDKVQNERAAVSRFRSLLLTTPAWASTPSSQPDAVQRSLVHCAAASRVGIINEPSPSGGSPSFKAEQEKKSEAAGIKPCASRPRKRELALGLSPNNTLQRSWTDKVLARGRLISSSTQVRLRALPVGVPPLNWAR